MEQLTSRALPLPDLQWQFPEAVAAFRAGLARRSATLTAVRYAHALRGLDESGEKVPAEAVSGNGESKSYYYPV